MNRKQRRAAEKQAGASLDGAFAQALAHHQVGELDQAEALYRKILARDARHLDSLNLIGAVCSARGDHKAALVWLNRAVAVNGSVPEVHNNCGVALEGLDRLEEAALHYQRALEIRPGFVDALTNLGLVRLRQGQEAEAMAAFQQVLAADPDIPEAQNALGVLLHRRGRVEEAVACFERATGLRSDFAQAFKNLGSALLDLAHPIEAACGYARAIELSPEDPEAVVGLASAEQAQGEASRALSRLMQALGRREDAALRLKFAEIVSKAPIDALTSDVASWVARAVADPWARPATLLPAALALLARSPDPNDALLIALLTSTPIADVAWEETLTARRRRLLEGGERDLRFTCALARQAFLTEYCWATTDAEEAAVQALAMRIAADLDAGSAIDPLDLARLAAYRSLASLPRSMRLMAHGADDAMRGLLIQQIAQPVEEMALAAAMPALTAIEDAVSQEVRAQYEENPYPRWARAAPPGAPITLDQHLRRQFPDAPYQPITIEGGLQALVAGTGTGQQAIETAQRYDVVSVLGVDLSRASLAYAQRMARSLGLGNIEFAQADILKLGVLERRFHLIESGGVLHHMADPLAGWRVLTGLLRPGGLMRIGLYSDIGRRDVLAAQHLIGADAADASPAAIRRLRQKLLDHRSDPQVSGILTSTDFFSLSECRDLLLHVHEHRLSLPVIAGWLETLGLNFLGFECAPELTARYRRRFPQDRTLSDLARWHVFETENPDAFVGMYQFWVQKG